MMLCVHRVQQANTLQLVQLLVQTVLQEITHQALGALSKKSVPQAPTVPTKGLQRVIFALLERILVLGQTSARSVMLAISPLLWVLPSVWFVMPERMHQTRALPSVSCVHKAKNPQREHPHVQIVEQTAFLQLDRQSVNPVPPDKRSPPAGPVTKSKTTQQAPACGGKQQISL